MIRKPLVMLAATTELLVVRAKAGDVPLNPTSGRWISASWS